MKYLTEKEITIINEKVINFAGFGMIQVLDPAGLNSIVVAPQQVFFGREAYPTIWLKAAYYLQKIAKKHVFADGNKRTAFEATHIFLLMNGYDLKNKGTKMGEFVLDVTNSPDSEHVMIKVAEFLKKNSTKL